MARGNNAHREKLNAVMQYLWLNARDKETYNLRWFSADNVKIAGISQTELSSLLVKLDRFGVLEKTERPGYGAGYSYMYRRSNLTDAQIRKKIDSGLAELLRLAKLPAEYKAPPNEKALETLTSGAVQEEG